MITLNTIRKQLEDIRYYNGRRDTFDKAFGSVGKNGILQIVDVYNQAICHASPRLYEIYVALYIECCTYELAAEELGFSVLERESNVILLDEFDKSHPVFHSAFYQLFDEGVFEDKNYQVLLYNSIIICTSNYLTEEEIRKNLGDPIFYRFDKFIKFEDLSIESIHKIIDLQMENKCKKLTEEELAIVNKEYIISKLKSVSNKIQNVRQIGKIIEEYLSMQLVTHLLSEEQ